MCGIAGYVGPLIFTKLNAMLDSLVHRGPDDEGVFDTEWFHCGMKRLSIVDISGGKQPQFNSAGNIAVLFNGEIYNAIDLRADLEKQGCHFVTKNSDTEVIVYLYEKYGISFIEKMNGMFAICLIDMKQNEMYIIRDRYGKKPIFYRTSVSGKLVSFASEFRTLFIDERSPDLSKNVNSEAFPWFFSQKTMPQTESSDRRVSKLPPGSYLKVDTKGNFELKQYYLIKNETKIRTTTSDEDVVDHLDKLLNDAVKIRMQADVEVGAYLSGGIDSSLVTCIASQHVTHPLKTYCLVYNEEIYNKSADRKFSLQTSHKFGTNHQEILLTPDEFIQELPNAVTHFGQPYAGSIANWFISKAMKKDLKVAVSGDGADEIFGSYFLHRVAAGIRDESKNLPKKEQEFVDSGKGKPYSNIINQFAIFPIDEQKKLLNPNLKSNVQRRLEETWAHTSSNEDTLNRMLEFESKNTLVELILSYADNLSMAHSIEVRVPFLDYRIVDYVFSLDSKFKIKNGETKYILKKLAERYLPKDQIYRPKEGFIEPAVFWLKDKLKPFALDVLNNRKFNQLGLLQVNYVKDLIDRFYQTNDFELGKRIWALVMFGIWENHYCDS